MKKHHDPSWLYFLKAAAAANVAVTITPVQLLGRVHELEASGAAAFRTGRSGGNPQDQLPDRRRGEGHRRQNLCTGLPSPRFHLTRLALGGWVMGDRSEGVGERGQFFPFSRRIVDLCNENTGKNWTALPLPQ